MGRTFDSLRRAERERRLALHAARPAIPSPDKTSPRALWRRWLGRPDPEGRAAAELAAWVVSETRSLGARLDALDEKLDKKLPEAEGRILRLLESAADRLEGSITAQARAVVAEELGARLAEVERRAALARGVMAVVVLALLVTLALR